MDRPFPLLKSCRNARERHSKLIINGNANPFPGKNAPYCTILQYNLEIFPGEGVIPPDPRRSAPVLGPRCQFPLGSSAFPLLLLYETTTGRKCGKRTHARRFAVGRRTRRRRSTVCARAPAARLLHWNNVRCGLLCATAFALRAL